MSRAVAIQRRGPSHVPIVAEMSSTQRENNDSWQHTGEISILLFRFFISPHAASAATTTVCSFASSFSSNSFVHIVCSTPSLPVPSAGPICPRCIAVITGSYINDDSMGEANGSRRRHGDDEEGDDDHADPEATSHAKRSAGGEELHLIAWNFSSSPFKSSQSSFLSSLLHGPSVVTNSPSCRLPKFPTLVAILIHPLSWFLLSLRRSMACC